MEQKFTLKDMVGVILVPVIFIVVFQFFFNRNKATINKNGVFVVAKKIKWETDESMRGISIFEFYVNGVKIVEEAGGCGDSEVNQKYFVIQYYKNDGLNQIDYKCSDSISYLRLNEIDMQASWKVKPAHLLKFSSEVMKPQRSGE